MSKHERITKYVYRNHRRYYVVKRNKILANCDTQDEAIRVRNTLIESGVISPSRRGRKPRCEDDRYIRRTDGGTYMLQKSVNGRLEYFGTFKTLEDARDERDLLESIDWKWEDVDLL